MAGLRGDLYFTMLVAILLLGLLSAAPNGAEAQAVGVCYGLNGNNLPPPSAVVGLLRSKNIRKVRLFEPNRDVLQAIGNSGIEVNLAVPNSELQNIANNPSAAGSWVATNIQAHPAVTFGSITVGNELIPGPQAQLVLPAMQNIYNSIQGAGLGGRIKVSTVVSTAVTTGFPPSAGVFTPQAMPFMVPIVQFLARTGAPLMVTVYPYFAYVQNDVISLDYALFRANYDVVTDGSLRYRNLFDALVDTVYSAIEKVDVPGLQKVDGLDSAARIPIKVTESGWPSRGRSSGYSAAVDAARIPSAAADAKVYDATVSDASTYNQNLVNHVAQGTPKRPGTPVDTYVFALFNENLKPGAEIEQNFGLFYPNMQPVYNINFP
ncbi:glucan endo-1,3-beta-glucosidase-like isoform X2 [Nymphaea colorata]|nr:glucan endo-1,3-beta-glucosidase-like isoform X2 [Nymphaea colorata]